MKKLGARNQLKGKVVEVRKGQTTAHVRVDIGNGVIVTSSITNEAVDDLALAKGDDVVVVIKASDVMIGKRAESFTPKPQPYFLNLAASSEPLVASPAV
jgi:molybdopterin-binding protein